MLAVFLFLEWCVGNILSWNGETVTHSTLSQPLKSLRLPFKKSIFLLQLCSWFQSAFGFICSSAKGNWNLVEFEGRGLSIHWGVGCPVSLTDGCLSLTFPTSSLKDRHSHQYVFKIGILTNKFSKIGILTMVNWTFETSSWILRSNRFIRCTSTYWVRVPIFLKMICLGAICHIQKDSRSLDNQNPPKIWSTLIVFHWSERPPTLFVRVLP